MRIEIDSLPIEFPYEYIYPEQFKYMKDIKSALDHKGHCLLEMPSGTGKTIALLSLIVAYQMHYPEKRKLIYCSRTVPEIDKALAELKRLIAYRKEAGMNESFLGIGLSSRKNLCVHPVVSMEKRGSVTDSKCRDLTSPWIRERGKEKVELCDFYENLYMYDMNDAEIKGVFTLDDFKYFAKEKHFCPYYFARKLIPAANVIIYSYHYLLDPKVAEFVSKELAKDSIVVFDEAHNIDNVCTESLSSSSF